ncbi:MAG TPA: asparagine synthase-related protein [Blastocatellia bacterium]|nr:asparagine synthase-related protein [Blastocatellia bacterium]
MGEFGGILNFDREATVEPVALTSLLAEGMAEVKAAEIAVDGPLGIGFDAAGADRLSRSVRQPMIDRHGHVFAFDGLLHNRDELRDLLSDLLPKSGPETADVNLVGAAYLKWRRECFGRLIGDFALTVWDARDRTLFLARDHAGTRTLYYHVGKDRIVWSSRLASLLSAVGKAPEIEEEYVACYLVFDPPSHLTPFRNLFAVQPGHVVAVRNRQLAETRYWSLNSGRELRYRSDREYEDHYFQEFKQAVRCRTRSDGPVFAELSGGLDSSAVVCMADHLVKNGEALSSELRTVSEVADLSPKSNELKFMTCVEEHIGRPGIHLKESECPLFIHLSPEGAGPVLTPLLFCAEYHYRLGRVIGERNGSVLLSGQGGDEVNYSSCDPTAELCDLAVHLKLRQLHRQIRVWGASQRRSYPKVLWRNVVAPMLPSIRRGWAGWMVPALEIPRLMPRSFIEKNRPAVDRLLTDPFGFRRPSGRDQAVGYWSAVLNIAAGHRRQVSDFHVSYPYLHRPLVEFLQAVPIEQKVRPGQTRSLHRRALARIMPDRVVKRRGKGDPGEALCRAVEREWPRLRSLFDDARVYQYGYIDRDEMEAALERSRHGIDDLLIHIVKIVPLEIWLRSLDGPRGRPLGTDFGGR